MNYPYLKTVQGKKVLMVHEKPFIMLAGEVHNSNASNAEYMESVWDKADELKLNSILLPVSWELVEPDEGRFDFSLIDKLIFQAREHGKKIGFLWFGSWKNAQCYYAPSWVKTDQQRFPRAEIAKGVIAARHHGMTYTTLSAFCRETMEADANAFAHFMAHLRSIDENENTVVCIQVENETGILGTGREHSEQADRFYEAPVPKGLINWLTERRNTLSEELRSCFTSKSGNWETVFGAMAEEAFTAYYTAVFVGQVAQAGKKEYPLPMVTNCWLDKGQLPGKYPTGGPVAKVMDIWHYAAPSIDIIAPDIYVPYFCDVCEAYAQKENPLFIAECATHSYAGLREIYTVGHHHAICYSPFGFEDMGQPFTTLQGRLFGMDTDDEALKTPQDIGEYAKINQLLQGLMPLIAEKYGTNLLQGAISERGNKAMLSFDEFAFDIDFASAFVRRKNGACLLLQLAENEFYALLCGCSLNPLSLTDEKNYVDFLSVEEGNFIDGVWKSGRRLNGDEITLMMFEEPTLLKIKMFSY